MSGRITMGLGVAFLALALLIALAKIGILMSNEKPGSSNLISDELVSRAMGLENPTQLQSKNYRVLRRLSSSDLISTAKELRLKGELQAALYQIEVVLERDPSSVDAGLLLTEYTVALELKESLSEMKRAAQQGIVPNP